MKTIILAIVVAALVTLPVQGSSASEGCCGSPSCCASGGGCCSK